jgi:glycosyltransferase involved in cell wall biosynthesis
MVQSMLVSIVMPVFNGERFLRQAVDSVIQQEYLHWELIVVDDGSTDETRRIIQGYNDQRIRYSYKENGGQASALNAGLRLARGDLITTLDADDWLPPNSLSERVRCLEAHPEHGAVYTNGTYTAEDGTPLSPFSDYCATGISGDLYGQLIATNMFGTGAAVTVRAEAIRSSSLWYDENIVWCQDWDFYIRLAESITFIYCDMEGVNYRLHSSNMTMQIAGERQRNAMVRTRWKIMESDRFQRASADEKRYFFYHFLRENTRSYPKEQQAVIDHPAFNALPESEKASLLRFIALDYLLAGSEHEALVRSWLRHAMDLDPHDRKIRFIWFVFSIHSGLARYLVRLYRKGSQRAPEKNLLQLIRNA